MDEQGEPRLPAAGAEPHEAPGAFIEVPLRADFARYDFALPMLRLDPGEEPPLDDDAAGPSHPAWPPPEAAGRPARRDALAWFLTLPALHAGRSAPATAHARMPAQDEPPPGAGPAPRRGRDHPVPLRRLSELPKLRVYRERSLAVGKCIYPRLPLGARDAVREIEFLAWAEEDPAVLALCRLDERHAFPDLAYPDDAGRHVPYRPHFVARTAVADYLVDLHEEPAAAARRRVAMRWCELVNALPAAQRGDRPWLYAPLGPLPFTPWRRRQTRLSDLLAGARFRLRAAHGAPAD